MLAMKMKDKHRKNKFYFLYKIKRRKNKATREHRATQRIFKIKEKILLK